MMVPVERAMFVRKADSARKGLELNAGHNLCLVSCVFLSGPQALCTGLYL